MLKRIINTLIFLSVVRLCYSQTVEKYEYWIDSEYDSRIVTLCDTSVVDFTVSLAEQSPGVHSIHIRAKNAGKEWGAPTSQLFYLPTETEGNCNVAKYQYWMDEDYANRIETSTTEEVIPLQINVESLSSGVHYFNFRSQNEKENWGGLYRYVFFIPENTDEKADMNGYEYWFDYDYAHRRISTSTATEISEAIDISQLQTGIHFYNYRAKNSDGYWGGLVQYMFFIPEVPISASSLASYEYWIDNDLANKTVVNSESTDVALSIDVSSVASGVHVFNYRAKDNLGQYSAPINCLFYLPETPSTLSLLGGYEYWIDDDYEHKVSSFSSKTNVKLSIPLDNLSYGIHRFNFREKNARQEWSAPSQWLFYFGKPELADGKKIVGYRYQFNGIETYVPLEERDTVILENLIIPLPDINELSTVDENCAFVFDEDTASLNRSVSISFSIQFKSKDEEWTMPVVKNFNIDDTLRKTALEFEEDGTISFPKLQQGDFEVIKLIAKRGAYYTIKSDQLANILIYQDNEIYTDEITPNALKSGVTIGLDAGIYYAVIYNTKTDLANDKDSITVSGNFYVTKKGDVNDDGVVNVSDVTMTVSLILGNAVEGTCNRKAADANNDGVINVSDVTRIVGIILNN